jgi:hypothetical protein
MKQRFSTTATFRHLIVPAPRLSEDRQRERARLVVPLGGIYQEFGPDQREEWYSLSRESDVLLVDQLELIPPPRKKGSGVPTAEFGEVRGWLRANSRVVIECSTGLEPTQKRWQEAAKNIARGHRILIQGHLGTDKARDLGKRRGAQMKRESLVDYYKNHRDHGIFAAIWRGTKGDAETARAKLNAYLEQHHFPPLGSEASCRRAFGVRKVSVTEQDED